MEQVVQREFKELRETISPENVQVMAELITIKQTKTLAGYIGESAIRAHEQVYLDVVCKNQEGYILSDYYELVQDVALFLCEHFGKHLDDYLYTSKKGRNVTIKGECYYIIKRELYHRYHHHMKNCSLESLKQVKGIVHINNDEEIEKSYERVDQIIALMNLNEIQLLVLNCRIQQLSYAKIGAMLNRTSAGAYSQYRIIVKRYNQVMQNYQF